MDRPAPNLTEILQILEGLYGPQKAAGPSDPYEMIVYLNCGYPATDTSCAKGFDALRREVGLSPKELLAAPKAKLAKLMRMGGIVPEQRADRLKEIARRVKEGFGGKLTVVLKKRMQEEKKQPGKAIRGAKKILQEFPVIGEPSAEKILLFSKLAPIAAVPSACVRVPIRLFVGEEGKNYAADYRAAREILSADCPRRLRCSRERTSF
jgi:endonuclease III